MTHKLKLFLRIGEEDDMKKGFTLMEMLVVIGVIGMIGVITSGSIITSIRGSKRTDSDTQVRQSVDYTIAVIERQLRNARSVTCDSPTQITYTDPDFRTTTFSRGVYRPAGSPIDVGYIASGSATTKLTGAEVNVTSVTFTCTPAQGNISASVTVVVNAEDSQAQGIEKAEIIGRTTVYLRTNI
jgi:prepilin-type N-terminal cleavage/methylation domain-containing protein